MKFGPLTIHQNGHVVKRLRATPKPLLHAPGGIGHSLENVRLSLHLERFECNERFSAAIQCIIRFPEFGYELNRETPCEMRAGQAHGAALLQTMCLSVDFEHAHDTVMEVEYFMGSESLEKHSVNIRFPAQIGPQ